MASPTIKIDQPGLSAGTAGQSRDDLVLGAVVTLTEPANPGAAFAWVMTERPVGSTATLSGASSSTATFTPDVAGTYLIEVVVNGALKSYDDTLTLLGSIVHTSTQGGCGVKTVDGDRIPANSETKQFDSTEGWHTALDSIVRRLRTTGVSIEEFITSRGSAHAGFASALALIDSFGSGTLLLPDTLGPKRGVTSITRSGSVVTVTAGADHGLTTEQEVVISGCTETDYNGRWTITVTGSATFTYSISTTPATPATGAPILQEAPCYLIDGATPLVIATNELRIEATGPGVVVKNISATGVDLFHFTPATGTSVLHCEMDGFSIVSDSLAGHVFYTDTGFSFCTFRLNVQQLNPLKAIIKAVLDAPGGIFENEFWGKKWEVGTNNVRHRVPAVDVDTSANIFVANRFAITRYHCHHHSAPFFSIRCSSAGTFNRANVWQGPINVENCRAGWLYLEGHQCAWIGPVNFFDTNYQEGHLIELATGSGGQSCDHTTIVNTMNLLLDFVTGVAEPKKTITALSRVGGVATATSVGHGLTTGDRVHVEGATPSAYNTPTDPPVPVVITVTGTDTFTYPIAAGTDSATGVLLECFRIGRKVATITRSGSTATVTTTAVHGLETGQQVYQTGADQSEYNGLFTATVTSTTAYTITVSGTPASGTGSITTQASAMMVKLSPECRNTVFDNCGATFINAVDVNNTGHAIVGDSKLEVYRQNNVNPNYHHVQVGGTSPHVSAPEFRGKTFTSLAGGPVLLPKGFISVSPSEWDDVTISRDGPVQPSGVAAAVPLTDVEWLKVGLPVPRSWWGMQDAGEPVQDAGLDNIDLVTNATLDYQQAVTDWTRKSIALDEIAGEGLELNDLAYDPSVGSVAALVYARINATGAATRLIVLGTTVGTAGSGGQHLRFTAAGLAGIQTNGGTTISGTTNYEADGDVHAFLLVSDLRNETITLYTDQETVVGTWDSVITNSVNKGFGGNGALTPPDCDLVLGAWWYGVDAETVSDLGRNALARLGWYTEVPVPGPRLYQKGGIDGLELSWTSASQVTAAIGGCRADDDSVDITTNQSLVADITVAGVGGRDTGSETADSWWAVWIIGDSTETNSAVLLLSISATAPTLPGGYDKKRLIGWVRNDGSSNLRHFYQRGAHRDRRYYWDEARGTTVDGLNALHATGGSTAIAFTDVDLTGLVAPNCDLALLHVAFEAPSVGGAATDILELRTNGATSTNGWQIGSGATLGQLAQGWRVEIPTDAAHIIEYRATDADDLVDIWVVGFCHEI